MLPAFDPRDFAADSITEVQGGLVDRQFVDRCPQFQLIAVTVTLVAVVSARSQVDGERSTARGR